MKKKLRWVQISETDVREVMNVGSGSPCAIIGDPLIGWGPDTHTVMADDDSNDGYGPYTAHVNLTPSEADALPKFESVAAYWRGESL